jgi:hypothetical protein
MHEIGDCMEELTIRDLNKLDIIDLTDEEFDNIIAPWCYNNKEKIMQDKDNIKHIFDKGVINIKQTENKFDMYTYFEVKYLQEKEIIELCTYAHAYDSKELNFCWNLEPQVTIEEHINSFVLNETMHFNWKYYKNKELDYVDDMEVYDTLQKYFSIIIYSQLNEEHIIRQTKTTTKKIQSKKDKRAGKKPKVKLLKQTIIRLNTDHIQLTEEDKRDYERHKLGWTVRGHWRHYQSGKEVWIKPQVRGDKENVEGKIYEV